MHLSSQCFKGIVDEMTVDEIIEVWSVFDDHMSHKFFSGLEKGDILHFTDAEWIASVQGFSAHEFKTMFFDQMDLDEIMMISEKIDPFMDTFLEELTLDDWRHMTQSEWDAFFIGQEIDELVEFIHEMHQADP